MESQTVNLISETVKDFFNKIGFGFENLTIEENKGPEDQELFVIKIDSKDDCSLLLDQKGRNLKALEHLAKLLVTKKTDRKISLVLDLNNFLEKRNNQISELARLVAQKVQTTQRAYVLRPMSAYERRLVHMELADWQNISTESIGEEPRRRVVVKLSF